MRAASNAIGVPVLVALIGSLGLSACKTDARTGAAVGAGAGAVAGQIIGGDTGSTLLGAAIGAGAGYMIGNERDKAAAEKERAAAEQAAGEPEAPRTETSTPSSKGQPLAGTRWHVISLVAAEPHEYASKLVDFGPEVVTCTTTMKDGTVKTEKDRYKIVGDAMVITRPNAIINAQFEVDGDQLIISCNEFRAVLKKL